MSNAIRFSTDEIAFRLDAATARRQFSLSLAAGLAVLAVAAMIERAADTGRARRPSAAVTDKSARPNWPLARRRRPARRESAAVGLRSSTN